ncbi:hypothetical protein KBD71_00925 [Candidatus Woesebacteria bacterium]|nr:hypothetical protein [Candidatus Woesebacteria bacterium]
MPHYSEITQKNRNELIASLQQRANVSYSDADQIFERYFDCHREQIQLINSVNLPLHVFVNSIILWTNQLADSMSSKQSRVAAQALERY